MKGGENLGDQHRAKCGLGKILAYVFLLFFPLSRRQKEMVPVNTMCLLLICLPQGTWDCSSASKDLIYTLEFLGGSHDAWVLLPRVDLIGLGNDRELGFLKVATSIGSIEWYKHSGKEFDFMNYEFIGICSLWITRTLCLQLMLLVRLLASSRLLVVKFWGSQKSYGDPECWGP